MATIRDVALRAGLAISTVSAVINRSAPVSQDALDRVHQAIAAVGYIPHGGARSLRSGKSQLIGLVVPNIANPWCGTIAREIENVCLNAGYTSVVYSSGQDPKRESQVLRMMQMQRVAGLVVIPSRSDKEHGDDLVNQIHVPTVLLSMQVEGLPYDVIKTDNVEAGRLATEYLLGLGHRRIGIILGIPGLATSDDRHGGYLRAHAERGLVPDPSLCMVGEFDQTLSHDAAMRLLTRPDRPTAIMTVSNMTTIGLLFAVRERGLKVPSDLSIVGIDDLDFSAILEPQPTVVITPVLATARRSMEVLLDQIAGRGQPTGRREIWAPELIVRGSCAAVSLG